MEKLTERLRYVLEDTINCLSEVQEEIIKAALSRFAAYEDTGLEPEDIKAAFTEETVLKLAAQALGTTPAHLRELVKAQKEGRVVVLEDVTVYQANTIMGMCERLNAMKARRGDDQEPLITWQLYNALLKSFTRTEAEAALSGGIQT